MHQDFWHRALNKIFTVNHLLCVPFNLFLLMSLSTKNSILKLQVFVSLEVYWKKIKLCPVHYAVCVNL